MCGLLTLQPQRWREDRLFTRPFQLRNQRCHTWPCERRTFPAWVDDAHMLEATYFRIILLYPEWPMLLGGSHLFEWYFLQHEWLMLMYRGSIFFGWYIPQHESHLHRYLLGHASRVAWWVGFLFNRLQSSWMTLMEWNLPPQGFFFLHQPPIAKLQQSPLQWNH